jgi:small nuclear ribonucleoprotein D3
VVWCSRACVCVCAVTMTARNGRVSKLEQVFLRGGHVKLVVVPDLLKHAPIFKKVQAMKAAKGGDKDKAGSGSGKPRK